MRRNHVLAALVIMMAALALPAMAQHLIIKGKIIGPDGAPMKGAKLTLTNTENGIKRTLTTDKKGEFFQLGIDAGNWQTVLTDPNGQELWKSKIGTSYDYPEQTTELDLNFQTGDGQSTGPEGMRKFKIGGGGGNQTTTNDNSGGQPNMVPNPSITPEQRARIEENQKKKALYDQVNAKYVAANDAEKAGQIDQAISLYKEAVGIDPSYWQVWRNLALAQLHAKQYPDSATSFAKTIELMNQDPKKDPVVMAATQHDYGIALINENKVTEAVEQYRAAIAGDPSHAAKYNFDLGVVLAGKSATTPEPQRSQMIKESNAAFDAAVAADPNFADAYYQKALNLLGEAKTVNGKMVAPPGTEDALNKYLELQPTGPNAESAKALLAEIGAKVKGTFTQKPK